MWYKILKNKKFHIPMDLLKEADRAAEEQEKLEARVNAMTDEEYDAYVEASFEEAEKEIERGEVTPHEVVMKEMEELIEKLNKEQKNYENWKRLLGMKKQGVKLRYII